MRIDRMGKINKKKTFIIPREFFKRRNFPKEKLVNFPPCFFYTLLEKIILFSLGKMRIFFLGKTLFNAKKNVGKISPAYFRNKTTFDVGRSYRSGSLKFTCSKKKIVSSFTSCFKNRYFIGLPFFFCG